MPKKEQNLTFEQAMTELENIADKLESGDLSLDKSLDQFEQGMKLAKICEDKLNEASGRVEKVMQDLNENNKTTVLNEDEFTNEH